MFSNRVQLGKKDPFFRCFFFSLWPILATFAAVFLEDFTILGNSP